MRRLLKQVFIGLVSLSKSITSMANASTHTKCIVDNQQSMSQPNLIKWYLNGCSQGLWYYPFVSNLVSFVETCNNLNDLSKRVFLQDEAEDLNVHVFTIIIGKLG